jgi:hypothetical protein
MAGVLLLISLTGWLYHRTQLADIAADHLRLQVIGPARLRPGMDNEFSVMTTSVTGTPVSAQVELSVHSSDQKRLMLHKEQTDENGRLRVTIPADLEILDGAGLEVLASHGGMEEKVATRLAVEPVAWATHLALEKPVYRPGETMGYRSLTLSRFLLAAGRRMPVEFEILDPHGDPVPGSRGEDVTRGGFACGRWSIPQEMLGGKYTLLARSPGGAFPDERRTFFIARDRLPKLIAKLEFARSSYGPGDTVVADFSAERVQGGAAAKAALEVAATLDGQSIHDETAEASEHGTFHVEFPLPKKIEHADARLVVVVDDRGIRETIVKQIPFHHGPIDVRFYPEGGELVAGLENRVYFAARDPLGRPVEVRGNVVDSQGQRVVGVATTHRGMGAFSIAPRAGEEYRLLLGSTADTRQVLRLPEVSSDAKIVLSTGLGVFQAGKPLEFNVRASQAGLPLVASAWCRGMPVGQQAFITSQSEANPVIVPLARQAGGVIRLMIYDYGVSPPKCLAERLVYRRPARRLQVDVGSKTDRYSPGEQIDVSVAVTDEDGNPASASLGVGLVPEVLLDPAGGSAPAMPLHFLLATEVDGLEDLGDATFYSGENREADVALDLLLGTQGWRRFLEEKLQRLDQTGREDERLRRLAALGAAATPPAVFDNLVELQQRYRENLATYRANRTRTSNTLTTLSFFGGVGLVILVAMLNLLGVASGARLWATAIAAASACLIVGGFLMDPGRWKSPPEGAVPYVPFDTAPDSLPVAAEPPAGPQAERGQHGTEPSDENGDHTGPGIVRSDARGRARIGLLASGPVGSLRLRVDAHADGGRLGHGVGEVLVRTPLQLAPTLPLEVSPGDEFDVPLAILNETDAQLHAQVVLEHDGLVERDGDARKSLDLGPGAGVRCFFPLRVVEPSGHGELTFRVIPSVGDRKSPTEWAGQLADEVTCPLKVVPPEVSASGGEGESKGGPSEVDPCPVRVSTRLDGSEMAWGRAVALAAEVSNTTDQSQPMVVAVLGLPAGLELRLDQLEHFQRAGVIDCYETRAREVICYWRKLSPNEQVNLTLDLVATVPGKFTGPAPLVYLHDAADRKHRGEPLVIEITRD